MIAVENYIKELLFDSECVILPGFGGLLSSYKSAYYNSIKATYYPPTKIVAFNSALKNNDWFLANEISSNENISKEEALKVVERFISNIEISIKSSGNPFKIDGIGSFSLNKEGAISFLPSLNSNYFEDSFGLEPIQISKIKVEDKTEEIVKRTQTLQKEAIMSEEKNVKVESEQKEKQSSFFIIAPIVLLLIAGGAFTWFMVDKDSFKNVASFGFMKGHKAGVSETHSTDMISEGVHGSGDENIDSHEVDHNDSNDWADSHSEDSHESHEEDHHDANWHVEHDDDHAVEQTQHDLAHEEHLEENYATVEQAENGMYHVIAGAFEVEGNATAFAQKTSGSKIIKGRKYSMVSVGSYNSESEAEKAIATLSGEYGSGLWVFKN